MLLVRTNRRNTDFYEHGQRHGDIVDVIADLTSQVVYIALHGGGPKLVCVLLEVGSPVPQVPFELHHGLINSYIIEFREFIEALDEILHVVCKVL